MTNEEKFLVYLEELKVSGNQKLVECVQEGFKTLVEYQVVGDMSERGIDLMEDVESKDVSSLVAYIEKLDQEISELRDAMQSIDDIADKYDTEDEREPMEEAYVMSTDGVDVATSGEGLEASSQEATAAAEEVEKGGSLEGRDPQEIEDIDPRDIEPIEIGQRFVKVESSRKSMNEVAPVVGIIGRLAAQLLAGAAIDDLVDRVSGDADSTEKEAMKKEVEEAAEKMRVSQQESYESSEELPTNIRRGEAAGNDAEESDDYEGKMANKQLDQIHDQAGKLAGSFADDEELKAWVQAKITKAHQTLDVIYEYFREEKQLDEKPEHKRPEEVSDEEISDGQPIFEK